MTVSVESCTPTRMNALPQMNRPIPYYGTIAAFDRLMARLKASGFPRKMTSSLLIESGVKSEEAYRITSGFKALGWIDEDSNPSDNLRALVSAHGGDSWPETLRRVLRESYRFIPGDWETLTPESLRRSFVSYVGRDIDAIKSAETFFLAAATEAGIPLSVSFSVRVKLAKPSLGINSERVPNSSVPPPSTMEGDHLPPNVFVSFSKANRFADQLMDLIALADDPGMSVKEKESVLVLAAYLRRRYKSEKN